jgi:hypothetical protein
MDGDLPRGTERAEEGRRELEGEVGMVGKGVSGDGQMASRRVV